MVKLAPNTLEVITKTTPKEDGLVSLTAEVIIQKRESFIAQRDILVNGDVGQAVYDEVNRIAQEFGYTILSKTDKGYALHKIQV